MAVDEPRAGGSDLPTVREERGHDVADVWATVRDDLDDALA